MRFSVIIPVYNGAHFLRQSLAALSHSTFADYECLVVDDGSTDDSGEVARGYGATVITLERRGGPARARNRGAQRASGEFLVFLDADVCVHPITLTRFDAHLRREPDTDAVMGSYDDRPAHPSFLSQYRNLLHHYVHHRSRTNAWTFWAACGAIRRDLFQQFGGFDESYVKPSIEDIELGMRLAAAGHRIDLAPEIQITHLKRWTFGGLVKTDLFQRAVPWFRVLLRMGSMPNDMNVTYTERLSVVLAWLLLLGMVPLFATLISRWWVGAAWALSLILPIKFVFVALNRDVYRFFAAKRGWWFALRAMPLHWLYYVYCGLGVIMATYAHLRGGARDSPQTPLPSSFAEAPKDRYGRGSDERTQ